MESHYAAVVLSKGGTWKPSTSETPYLLPDSNGLTSWPERSSARCVFRDTRGLELFTLRGKVLPDQIEFIGSPADMDKIPAGASFTITLETRSGTFPIRHGTVIRQEVTITTPLSQQNIPPLSLVDNLQRSATGRKWMPLAGGLVEMVDNSDAGLPIGMAARGERGAVRYFQEFTTPSIEIGVSLLNRNPDQAAWTSVNFGADINSEMGFSVRFETGATANRRIHIGTLTNPMTIIDRAPLVTNTVENNDYYLIRFIHGTKTVALYKGASLEPIAQWPDETDIVPRGIGYRHLSLSFYRSSTWTTKGIQITSITARDAA
ncbi:hypothetical protein [Arthrobacter sp. SLBN-53]|uniref:hypothetical protein n=1 Tax=Arthrobacter sp. SLBN-53 TaxID=2768412 RepID=UPI001152EA4B|nr:hypothetical protein [Arthrobacter sp. SLBN-53]TQK29372.1 hypothetical protein FBY28_2375 [Arthrobacter sp. SLBN-53]